MNPNTTSTDSAARLRASPATIGNVILVAAFFFPWINIFGMGLGGYELHKVWKAGPYLWLIPFAAIIAIILEAQGRRAQPLAQVAGGIPLVFLALALYQSGADLFKTLQFGGYLTIITGFFLLCVLPRLGKKPSDTADKAQGSTSQ